MAKKQGKLSSIVLDVLKSHKPSIIELGQDIKTVRGVKNVEIIVLDVDEETEKVQVIINGSNLSMMKIKDKIERFGASVHSLDEVIIN